MTEKVKRYLLVTDDDRSDQYGDDYWTVSRLVNLDQTEPLLWSLTDAQVQQYHNMFQSNRKYYSYRFVSIEVPTEVSIQELTSDMAVYLDGLQKAAKAREVAEAKRQAAIEAKRLKREQEKLAKDTTLRKSLYEQLKAEFNDN